MAYLLQDVENVCSSSATFSSIISLMKKSESYGCHFQMNLEE